MLSKSDYESAKIETIHYLKEAGIVLRAEETERIEVADFGLNRLQEIGLQLIVYVNTNRHCAKELVLFPYQTCPEHSHPPVNGAPGKEETFRCRRGSVYLYVEGKETENIKASIPKGREINYTVFNEVVLQAGDQYTIPPNTLHWFQAGGEGAVVSEFSTESTDEYDHFTAIDISRKPEIME